jgi:hypothetical protein
MVQPYWTTEGWKIVKTCATHVITHHSQKEEEDNDEEEEEEEGW